MKLVERRRDALVHALVLGAAALAPLSCGGGGAALDAAAEGSVEGDAASPLDDATAPEDAALEGDAASPLDDATAPEDAPAPPEDAGRADAVDDASRDAGALGDASRDGGPLGDAGDAAGDAGGCESDAELCASLGYDCGPVRVTDRCGRARTLACGTCAGSVCGGSGAVGRCAPLATPSARSVGGFATAVFPSRLLAPVRAMFAVGPDELWFSLDAPGPVYRWRRGQGLEALGPERAADSSFHFAPVTSIWASGPRDVWLSAPGTFRAYRYDGARVAAVPDLNVNESSLHIYGTGPDDVWLGGCDAATALRHLSGGRWSTVSLPCTSCCAVSLHGATAGRPLLVAGARSSSMPNAPPLAGLTYTTRDGALFAPATTLPGGFSASGYVETRDGEYVFGVGAVGYRPRGGAWSAVARASACTNASYAAQGDELWLGCPGNVAVYRAGARVRSFTGDVVASGAPGRGFVARADGIYEVRSDSALEAPVAGPVSSGAQGCRELRVRSEGLAYGLCSDGRTRWLARLSSAEGVSNLASAPLGAALPLWTNATSSVWSALPDGTIERRDGATGALRERFDTYVGQELVRLDGTSDDDVWVVTSNRALGHYDGRAWSTLRLSRALSGEVRDAVARRGALFLATGSLFSTEVFRVALDGAVTATPSTAFAGFVSMSAGPGDGVWLVTRNTGSATDCAWTPYEWSAGAWARRAGFPCNLSDLTEPAGIDGTSADVLLLTRSRNQRTLRSLRWNGARWDTQSEVAPPSTDLLSGSRFRVVSASDYWLGGLRVRN